MANNSAFWEKITVTALQLQAYIFYFPKMKCIITGGNVRTFGKAIHALSKIGIELYVEDVPDGLALKTVNSSRSGYASIQFSPSFFHVYDIGAAETGRIKCKISLKSCLLIFKSLATIDKTVEKCSITFVPQGTKFGLHLSCKYGIEKVYELACLESEVLQAVFDKDACSNTIAARFRLLNDAVQTFHNNQEEVTLGVTQDVFLLRNYNEETPEKKTVHTQLRLENAEFDDYQVEDEVEVTFSLKELRAALLFADTSDSTVNIHFTGGGRPIIFETTCPDFEANFVLATLADGDSVSSRDPESESEPVAAPRKLQEPTKGSTHISTMNTDEPVPNGAGPSTRLLPGERLGVRLELDIAEMREDDAEIDFETADVVPESPPSKRYKSLFRSATPEDQMEVVVLASDTDDDS